MPIYSAIVIPAAVAAIYLYFGWRRATRWLGALAAVSILVASWWSIALGGGIDAVAGLLRVDGLASYALFAIGVIAVLVLAGMPAQLGNEVNDRVIGLRTAGWYGVFTMVALAAAVIAVTGTGSMLGFAAAEVMVVAMASLVLSRRKAPQKRAALHYGMWSTGGVAVAAVGTLLPQGTTSVTLLGWAVLAGLAPLHWWLPATVSVASAPIAALIVGVQSVVAWTAIVRLDAASTTLAAFALWCIAVSAAMLVRQRDIRRLVGYLGIGLSGLVAFGLTVGLQARGLQLLLGMAVALTALYLAAGHVVSLTGSGRIATVRGLLSRNLLLGEVVGLGMFAAGLLVPFILGYQIVSRAMGGGYDVLGGSVAVGWAVITAAAIVGTWRMLYGNPDTRQDLTSGPARPLGSAGPVLVAGIIMAIAVPMLPSRDVLPAIWY